jgi:hypothetical protein
MFKRLGVLRSAHRYPKGRIHIADFLVLVDLVLHGLLHVEDLTTKGQDRLEATVPALFGRATGRVSFDQEQLATLGITIRTIGQLAGQTPPAQVRFYAVPAPALFWRQPWPARPGSPSG